MSRRLLILVAGVGFAIVSAALRSMNDGCKEKRVAELNANVIATHLHARTLEELVVTLEKDSRINCDGAEIAANALRCRVTTSCGFDNSLDATVEFHIDQASDGTWSVVR